MKNIYLFCILIVLSFSVRAQINHHLFKLKNGITVILVEDHKLAHVSVSLNMIRVPQLNGKKAGVVDLLNAMLNEGTQKRSKTEFNELLDLMDASISMNAFGGVASSLKINLDKTISLMAEAMMYPVFTATAFEKVKNQSINGLKSDERNINTIASRMTDFINFGANHPYGEFVSRDKMEKLTLDDVKNAYTKIYMPNNSYLVFVGDIGESEVNELANKYFATWPMGKLLEKPVPPSTVKKNTEVYLIDVPTASQSVVSITNVVSNSQKSPDALALNVATKVLGEGYLFSNLREKNAYAHAVSAEVRSDRYGATFRATANVADTVVEKAIKEMIFEMNRLMNEPADATTIALAKSKAEKDFSLGMEKYTTIADRAIDIERNDLPKNYYSNYLQDLNSINAPDIQLAAKQYLNPKNMSIVVIGRALEIGTQLETLGYSINYLDAYGQPIAKPLAKKAVLSAKELIDKYLTALGGVEVLKSKGSMYYVLEGKIEGVKFSICEARKGNKLKQEIKLRGNTLEKTLINDTEASITRQGETKPLVEEVRKAQYSNYAVRELMLLDNIIESTIKGIEDGNYVLETKNSWTTAIRYIDTKTYLLTKIKQNINSPNASNTEQILSNYKMTEGVQMAYTHALIGIGISIELTRKEMSFKDIPDSFFSH